MKIKPLTAFHTLSPSPMELAYYKARNNGTRNAGTPTERRNNAGTMEHHWNNGTMPEQWNTVRTIETPRNSRALR